MIIPEVCGDEAITFPIEECDACEKFIQELEALSDLVDQIQAILPTKQDKLTPGANIQISNQNVISATDTTYTAGTGISITGNNNAINAARNPDNTYTKDEVDALVAKRWQMKDVDVLPATGETNIIYLVPRSGTHNDHDMFIWEADKNSFKYIGRDTVDLSGYSTKAQTISNITRNGTTFTATRADGTTFTFDQQDTNTTYGASSPITLSGTTFGHANSGVTAGTYGPSANVTGTEGTTISVPQITVNATGHVTSVTNRTLTNKDTNTTYSASSPITLSGTAFGHANSGVTAGSYGPTANVTGTEATTINVPQITVNATGHVTSVVNRVLTNKNTTYGAATASAAGLMSAAHFTKVTNIGTVYYQTVTKSIPNNTATDCASITVPGGTYVVWGQCNFAATNGVGTREARMVWGSAIHTTATVPAGQYGESLNLCCVEVPAGQTSVTIRVYQNSGNAYNATTYIRAVRIA